MAEYIVTEHPDFPYEEPKPQELIRCKDCRWHDGNECTYEYYYDEYDSVGNNIPMYDDDFCSRGKRIEDGKICE